MNKNLLLMAWASCSFSALMAQANYEIGKPNDANYDYLKNLKPLKEYIDYEKYPNFKLGVGTTVNDYLNGNSVTRKVTDGYFTETVAGNAMKMSSCVNNNGVMNFNTVSNYVNTATAAGLNVYGHTLAWHSQQPIGWLGSLIKDKPAEELTSGDVKVTTKLYSKDFRTEKNIGWSSSTSEYGYSISYDNNDGLKIHTTKKCPNSWDVQFQAATNIPVEKGQNYTVKIMVKGTAAGNLHSKLGDWDGGPTAEIPFTTEWKEVEVKYNNCYGTSFLLLQCGDFVGDIFIRTISIDEEKWALQKTDDHRCIIVKATEKAADAWDNQFWISTGEFPNGAKFEFSADVRADKAASIGTQLHTTPGNYVHHQALGNIPFTTEWNTVKMSGTFSWTDTKFSSCQSVAFNLNDFTGANNYYFSNVSLKINGVELVKNGDLTGTDVSSFYEKLNRGNIVNSKISEGYSYLWMPQPIPMTAKEVHDTLVYAMDKWIKGMMEACGGKVKGWDVVNEAISGGGNDGQGNYALQHRNGYVAGANTWDVGGDAFYWQDYMGDLEYVRQAVRLARKYGPEDVKLFINDYNLESDWDGNKKLSSLINWIKKWESDGVTKIDGIGTQMHISYYMNQNTQASKQKAITKMFEMMAATGKLVRVSELDMGMVDASGNTLATNQLTEEMHHRMADYYEFIYKEYFRIVPPAQQWGICQWCATDAGGSITDQGGWRNGQPVGYWAQGYAYRKHAYAGVAYGLGADPTDLQEVKTDPINGKCGLIYDVKGQLIDSTFDALPAGLYIINGKKILKK